MQETASPILKVETMSYIGIDLGTSAI